MNSKIVVKLLIAICALGMAMTARGNQFNLTDHNLEQFLIESATHKDSGRTALRDKISEIEAVEGQFSPRLYGYVAELGRLKQASAEYEDAIDLYQRMQTLTHWMDGVHSPLQMESVRLQSRSLIAQGEMVAADKLERFHLWLAEKNHEGIDLLPSIWRMSAWQRMTLQFDKALAGYDRTLDIIAEEQLSTAYVVRTLEAKALTEHLAQRCCAKDSLELAFRNRLNSDFSDDFSNQHALLNLADLVVLDGGKNTQNLYQEIENAPVALLGPSSKNNYLKAIDSVDRNPMVSIRSEVWYPEHTASFKFGSEPEPANEPATIGTPVRLCSAQIAKRGYADVSMDVSPAGKPQNLVITGDAPRKTKKYLRAVLLKSRYRPEVKNGEAVQQTLAFRQYFDRAEPIRSDQVAGWRDLIAEQACQVLAMR